MSEKVVDLVSKLIQPILSERVLELVDVEYVKESSDWFLRVYLDKNGGIDLTECSVVSELLSEKLDALDPIEDAYFLEVSSPGAERPLKNEQDFINHLNHNVFVNLYAPIDGEKEYEGILKSFDDSIAIIEYKNKTRLTQVEIPYNKIAKARLAVTF